MIDPKMMGRAAFRLAMRGLYVFPLAEGTKIPVKGSHGCRGASRDADVARAWWQRWPGANVGVATGAKSRLWVLDIDPPEGAETLAKLEREHGRLPATVQASTPRGGTHYYFSWPNDIDIRNSAGRIGPGVDVRGSGGSVVAPPSILKDGRGYQWISNGATVASAPGWLVALTQPPPPPRRTNRNNGTRPMNTDRYVAAAVTDELRTLQNAGNGSRNDVLNRASFAVGRFVAGGAIPEAWAMEQLTAIAQDIGLDPREIARTIASAFKAAKGYPRELST